VSTSTAITAQSNAPDAAPEATTAGYPFARLMFWSMRRELWENRAVVIAPCAAAALMFFSCLIPVLRLITGPEQQVDIHGFGIGNVLTDGLWIPYAIIAAPIIGIGLAVAATYCLNALNAERRDRSILFWKSLPVSDLVTVLSKAAIPALLVPLVSFAAALVAQLAIFTLVLLIFPMLAARAGLSWGGVKLDSHTVGLIWSGVPVGYLTIAMLYALLAMSLWFAPLYAWLLLVGGWARRQAFLWAAAPVIGLIILERIGFGTDYLQTAFDDRLHGGLSLAFSYSFDTHLPEFTPLRFLAAPELWLGLVVAALFLAAAVFLRRYRQPI
jgi:ABC-2 type transport system permease protein